MARGKEKARLLALLLCAALTLALFASCAKDEPLPDTTDNDTVEDRTPSSEGLVFTQKADDTYEVSGYSPAQSHPCVLIPATHEGKAVTSIGDFAFRYCTGLTEITIPASVTSIKYGAFWGCAGLTEITIPAGVTSIGDSAFSYCTGLTEITIPASVTSIKYGAFWGCTGLTEITIPAGVTSIGDFAFRYCTNLARVTFAETEGWTVSVSDNAQPIAVNDPATNAKNLTGQYEDHLWRHDA